MDGSQYTLWKHFVFTFQNSFSLKRAPVSGPHVTATDVLPGLSGLRQVIVILLSHVFFLFWQITHN